MSSHSSLHTPRRAALRAHILAALGVAGAATACAQVPTPGTPKADGLYDAVDKDSDGVPASEDCHDGDSSIRPGAEEICNGVDDNCDGEIDEGVRLTFFRDADYDTFGNPNLTLDACELPEGYVENDDDCDDDSASALPGGEEVCDGLDNDCDGNTDNIDGFWPDDDGDGYGRNGTPASACEPMPEGYADNTSDCDDTDADIHPGMVEQCMDGIDNDCDGSLSCVVMDIREDTGADCRVTWAITYPEAFSGDPCEGCNFSFSTNLEIADLTGDSTACDGAGDRWTEFRVEGDNISSLDAIYVGENWMVDGDWTAGILNWYTNTYILDLGTHTAYASYMGELDVDEVESYYYYYYYEGRPFSVDGAHRVAECDDSAGTGWSSELRLADLSRLSPQERAQAAHAWTRAALAEHAAIASFNRFAMELMSLGAPPDLLADTLSGAADEIVHARDCFAVASRLAGEPVAPGAFPVDGALDDMSPAGILERVLVEGCVDETVSTALAALRLSYISDPDLRTILQRIIDDETRHATLAWRSARWILSKHPELRPHAQKVLAEALTPPPGQHAPAASPALRSLGVLSQGERARERARTLDEVVKPAVAALLGEDSVMTELHA